MRKELGALEGRRERFTATFSRFGTKTGWRGTTQSTILLVNIVHAASGKPKEVVEALKTFKRG